MGFMFGSGRTLPSFIGITSRLGWKNAMKASAGCESICSVQGFKGSLAT